MLSKKEIINKLIDDTNINKIKWKITVDSQFISASYNQEITRNKKCVFKIVYYKTHPKSTKLFIDYEIDEKYATSTQSIIGIGGNKKVESKDISFLLSKILSKNDKYKDIKLDLEDNFEIGDRVVVVRSHDHGEIEMGQKGTIIKWLVTDKDEPFFLIKFDNRFSNIMVSDDFEIGDVPKDGDCWVYRPDAIRKIDSKKGKLALSQKDFIGL